MNTTNVHDDMWMYNMLVSLLYYAFKQYTASHYMASGRLYRHQGRCQWQFITRPGGDAALQPEGLSDAGSLRTVFWRVGCC